MPLTTVALTADLPVLPSLTWPQLEAWAVAMRDEVPAAALAAAVEDVQARLIDAVCGPRWLPVRDLAAPFGCPGCGVMSDFARARGCARGCAGSTRLPAWCGSGWPTSVAGPAVGFSRRCC